MLRINTFSNFKQINTRCTRVYSISKHYTNKKTRLTREDVDKAIEEASHASKTHTDKKYISVQWDIAHEIFVHYARQEKYLAEEKSKRDALDSYCEIDESSMECREYDV